MRYFYDTEFLEGKQDKKFLGIKYGETSPTIDLISIGIVCEDGREYYAISKDFNLKEAWNRYDIKNKDMLDSLVGKKDYSRIKSYWIRDNVLLPIFKELWNKNEGIFSAPFTYKNFKYLINKYGKSNKQIAEEVKRFIEKDHHINCNTNQLVDDKTHTPVEFYGYYSDYDHVVLCWLFGKMINLPKGFPMYTIDLKQEFDRQIKNLFNTISRNDYKLVYGSPTQSNYINKICNTIEELSNAIKNATDYPKQINEHSSIYDAK